MGRGGAEIESMKRGLGLYKILGEKQVFAHERGFEPQIAQISRIKKPWQFYNSKNLRNLCNLWLNVNFRLMRANTKPAL